MLELATNCVSELSMREASVNFPQLSRMVNECLTVNQSWAAVETWSWNLMRLICLAEKDKETALDYVSGIACIFIGECKIIMPKPMSPPNKLSQAVCQSSRIACCQEVVLFELGVHLYI